LTSSCATELEGLGTLLELGEPLSTLAGPDIALVTMLEFELPCLHLNGFKIMDELNFLVEDLVEVISTEQLRLCVYDVSLIYIYMMR